MTVRSCLRHHQLRCESLACLGTFSRERTGTSRLAGSRSASRFPVRRRCMRSRRRSACRCDAVWYINVRTQARAGRSERVAERDRAAVHVALSRSRPSSFSQPRYCAEKASLISMRSRRRQLDATPRARGTRGSRGPDRCPSRSGRRQRTPSRDASRITSSQSAFGAVGGRHDQRGRPVDDAAGVAGRHRAFLAEGRAQLRQAFQRRVGA